MRSQAFLLVLAAASSAVSALTVPVHDALVERDPVSKHGTLTLLTAS